MVSINGGAFQPIKDLPAAYNVTVSDATRNIVDPDGFTNQWCIPIYIDLKAGESYRFAFQRGFEANNSNTVVLYEGTTTEGLDGYIGYVTSFLCTSDERDNYNENWNKLYQFPVVGSIIGFADEEATIPVYNVNFQDFYHSISITGAEDAA